MIVMKFGGTSVGNAERIRGACALVARAQPPPPLVVVSAVGGITDQLIAAARESVETGARGATYARIEERHRQILKDLALPTETVSAVDRLLGGLEEALDELAARRQLTPEALDRVMSFGERISARLFAAALEQYEKRPAVAVDAFDLGLRTDSRFGSARVDRGRDGEVAALCRRRAEGGRTVVTTGFLARDAAGRITTLGRGGSDLSGSLFGAMVGASEIQIWTDVDGVMTADPKVVPEAQSIPQLSLAEASELAYYGGKVLHPATMMPAIDKKIPILVKNTLNPTHPGTLIAAEVPPTENPVKAVTGRKNVTVVDVAALRMFQEAGFLGELFGILGRHGIVVDLVSTSEVTVSFTLDGKQDLAPALDELRARGMSVEVRPARAIICVVGARMRQVIGLAARACGALAAAAVNLEMISQGASEINLSFLVREADAEKAVRALHGEFLGQKKRK